MKNKKIMMIATTDNMLWQFLMPHIDRLIEMGNQVECVCARTGFWFSELEKKYITYEIDFKRNPFHPKNILSYFKLQKLHKERQYDVVYCQQPVGSAMGRLIGATHKIPVIYTAHGFHFFKGCKIQNNLIYKNAERFLNRYTTALITINEEDYEAGLKMKAKHVFKINGIGMKLDKYEPLVETKDEIRKSLGINDNDFVITTIAEYIKRKNYDTMLKVIKDLKDSNHKVKFLVCGCGKLEKRIKKLISKLDIENEVQLLGYRRDINRILTASDCFMLTSFQEGLPLAIIEAMNFALPCVVSDVRGNRDLVIDGKGGYVLPTKDHNGVSNAIINLIESKELKDMFGSFNLNESKKYDIDVVIDQLDEIYSKLDI